VGGVRLVRENGGMVSFGPTGTVSRVTDWGLNSAKACAHGGFWPWAWWAGFGAGLYCIVG
jgi:hypothetical protein